MAHARRTPDHSDLGVRSKCLEKGVRPAYAVRSVRLAYAVADGVRQAYSGCRGAPGVHADVGRARRALGAAHSRCALAFIRVRRTPRRLGRGAARARAASRASLGRRERGDGDRLVAATRGVRALVARARTRPRRPALARDARRPRGAGASACGTTRSPPRVARAGRGAGDGRVARGRGCGRARSGARGGAAGDVARAREKTRGIRGIRSTGGARAATRGVRTPRLAGRREHACGYARRGRGGGDVPARGAGGERDSLSTPGERSHVVFVAGPAAGGSRYETRMCWAWDGRARGRARAWGGARRAAAGMSRERTFTEVQRFHHSPCRAYASPRALGVRLGRSRLRGPPPQVQRRVPPRARA